MMECISRRAAGIGSNACRFTGPAAGQLARESSIYIWRSWSSLQKSFVAYNTPPSTSEAAAVCATCTPRSRLDIIWMVQQCCYICNYLSAWRCRPPSPLR